MTDDYKRERAWAETEIGRLFIRFESSLGRAWITDSSEGASDAAMKRDWNASNAARREFLKALRGW